MKVLTLVVALFALVYSDDEGTVDDPSQIPPGYVLQPDGTYLQTINEQGDAGSDPCGKDSGYILQPDGTCLMTVEEPGKTIETNTVVNEDVYDDDGSYTPKFSNDILTIGKGENKGCFKISHGDSGDENDYSVEPVESPDNPTPLNSDDKDAPKVYSEGTQGKPDYQNILGVGKGPNRGYLLMKPDSSKPSGFKFIPQYIASYTKVPGQVQPNVEEPTEDDEDNEIPDNPELTHKKGYSVISIGRPDCRRFVKLTPSKTNNPYEFDLKPIKHPDQPDSSPDDDDDDAPEIIDNGKRGSPDYEPIIASGPTNNKRYVGVVVDPKRPKHFTFVPVQPQTETGPPATEPSEDDVDFEDVPPNPTYKVVKIPGYKLPVEFVSVGHPKHRVHFKIVRRSNKHGDVQVTPILDPDNHNSSPNPNDEFSPEVVQQGDPSDPHNCPIVATGPRFRRVYHKLLITKRGVRFIPVRRQRIRGTKKYTYILKKRRWHYRRRIHKVIRHKHGPIIIKRTTTRRVNHHGGGFFGNIFGGLFGGHRRQANGVKRIVLHRPGGQVVGSKVITTRERIVDRGFHPTRPNVHAGRRGGFLFG